jgi:hypothetical protein
MAASMYKKEVGLTEISTYNAKYEWFTVCYLKSDELVCEHFFC